MSPNVAELLVQQTREAVRLRLENEQLKRELKRLRRESKRLCRLLNQPNRQQ